MELERDKKPGAESLPPAVTKASAGPSAAAQQSFYSWPTFLSKGKKYKAAKNYYDSLITNDPLVSLGDISWLPDRKAALAPSFSSGDHGKAGQLQRIAALPPINGMPISNVW